jgi:lipopolysaccharide/colanic/teichoic acid biosynthesis glycosyltransferase
MQRSRLGRTLYLASKRVLDLLIASILLIALSPLMLLIAVAVRCSMGAPVLFRQQRPGYQETIFTLYKFRTMRQGIAKDGRVLPDSERLTKVGKFLRSTSLDELPELINIIRGDMSLVGPRPLLVEYLPLYSSEQARRHEMRPGLTGWAQVNGRNAISWDERFALDVWYVNNASLSLDIRILLRTILTVFRRTGINAPGEATMHAFTGNQK